MSLNDFTEIVLTRNKKEKALPSLFYNKINSLKYKEINFDRKTCQTDAYQVFLSDQEVKAIQSYVKNLVNHKEDSSEYQTGVRFDYQKNADRYFQGFLGEYALAKLCAVLFKLDLKWDDSLRPHNQGDDGDLIIEGQIIDIKSKDYTECLKHDLYYDIKESKIKKCNYFVFTFIDLSDDIGGGALVDILGFESSFEVNKLETERFFAGKFSYKAKRISYNDILPIKDFFNIKF